MSIKTHIEALQQKHANLDDQVKVLQRCPGADSLYLAALKKEKLQLKETISKLQSPTEPASDKPADEAAEETFQPAEKLVPELTPSLELPAECYGRMPRSGVKAA